MLESSVYIVFGLILLASGGEFLVSSSSKVALKLGISPLMIGLTIVAFGTSAPELGVSLFAALSGKPEIALTNVIGSNIFNLGFILGACAILSPLVVNLQLIKIDIPIMIAVSVLTYLFCRNGQVDRLEGLLLFGGTFVYTAWLLLASKKENKKMEAEFEGATPKAFTSRLGINIVNVFVSVAILVVGSKLLVAGATNVASYLGVSSELIGLTIVAAGTSLPELATSVVATLKKQTDIAIGNVVGSNIFNLLLILGLSSSINSGLTVDAVLVNVDLLVMVGVAILCLPFVITAKKVARWEGITLFVGYGAYVLYLIDRG